jgi:nitronate monooxygenase
MLPEQWRERLRVPAIAAPMTDVSGPELVAAACAAGVIGAFPAHNTADTGELGRWLRCIAERAAELTPPGCVAAPAGVNLVVHHSNARLAGDLRAVIRGGAEVVVTSVGSPREVTGPLHDAGLTVLADVASLRHVKRAQEAGVDGVVLLTAGAGGQAGWANPIAFLRAVRECYDGIVVLAGGVSDGAGILAAQVLGADLAYLGTRFIATAESLASPEYRAAVLAATLDDITTTTQLTGLAANVLTTWLHSADARLDGAVDSESRGAQAQVAGTGGGPPGFAMDRLLAGRGVWAAGHSAAGTRDVLSVAGLVGRLESELRDARGQLTATGAAARPPRCSPPNAADIVRLMPGGH